MTKPHYKERDMKPLHTRSAIRPATRRTLAAAALLLAAGMAQAADGDTLMHPVSSTVAGGALAFSCATTVPANRIANEAPSAAVRKFLIVSSRLRLALSAQRSR